MLKSPTKIRSILAEIWNSSRDKYIYIYIYIYIDLCKAYLYYGIRNGSCIDILHLQMVNKT